MNHLDKTLRFRSHYIIFTRFDPEEAIFIHQYIICRINNNKINAHYIRLNSDFHLYLNVTEMANMAYNRVIRGMINSLILRGFRG